MHILHGSREGKILYTEVCAVQSLSPRLACLEMLEINDLDWTFSSNPRMKGTYSRRLSDIRLATGKFSTAKLPIDSPARFLGYYFGCEKLAKAILGIARLWPAEKAFHHKTPLDLEQLKSAVKKLNISVSESDLTKIFGTQPPTHKPTFGREIRNRLIHDFGPSNVDYAKVGAKTLAPVMQRFLACEQQAQKCILSLAARAA